MKYKEIEEKLIFEEEKTIMSNRINNAASIIAKITEIPLSKVKYFIEEFGIEIIFDNPSIMGITKEQEVEVSELKELILWK